MHPKRRLKPPDLKYTIKPLFLYRQIFDVDQTTYKRQGFFSQFHFQDSQLVSKLNLTCKPRGEKNISA